MKKIVKEIIPYVLIIVVVFLFRSFIATPVIVSGDSMEPTLKNNQVLLQNKIGYYFKDIKRFDIVIVDIDSENKDIIKRVIGLPGENVSYKDGKLYINDKEFKNDYDKDTDDFTLKSICNCERIPEGKYLVLGDNRKVSADSRWYGLISEEQIKGKTNISLWPIKLIK